MKYSRICSPRPIYFINFCQKNYTSWKWQPGTTHHIANLAVLETKLWCTQVMPTEKAFVLALFTPQTQAMNFFWQKDYFCISKRGLYWQSCSDWSCFRSKRFEELQYPNFSSCLESWIQQQKKLTIHILIRLNDFWKVSKEQHFFKSVNYKIALKPSLCSQIYNASNLTIPQPLF